MPFFTADYSSIKEDSLQGRYITHAHIKPLLEKLDATFKVSVIGKSVQGTAIEQLDFGKGEIKILMWSQMHGNESTTTKAVFDLLNFMKSGHESALAILENCTIRIIPMLNPDGAKAYTRANVNGIDLNRDAQNLSQPESKVLRKAYDDFRPDFCFNLHGQRTMYNVGDTEKPATLSFLAPAFDQKRSQSGYRLKAMFLIHQINKALQDLIPGQVGRYDDSFNANCVGDTFQMLKTPTVLFEAGHFPNDYERERTREFIFIALLEAIAATDRIDESFTPEGYLAIPENGKQFYDILIKNAAYFDSAYDSGVSLGIRFEEKLLNQAIHFEPRLEAVFGDGHHFGHETYDCANEKELQKLKKQSFYTSILVH